MLTYVTASLPILGWGFMPIIANLRKSSPVEQLLGTAVFAFIFSIITSLIMRPEITLFSFTVSFISGVFWSIGQLFQFKGIQLSSVSKIMPLSNGSQLIFISFTSVLLFQEWTNSKMYMIGTLSIIMIVIGILCTSYQQTKVNGSNQFNAYGWTLLSSVFLMLYVLTNQLFSIEGYQIILPQSVGMIIASSIIYLYYFKGHFSFSNLSYNLITGFSWSVANLGMFLTTIQLGVATSFSISQSCVIVATLGGIIFFKEKKTRKEWLSILLGIALIMLGVFSLGSLK
ncbi:GRP family sugar transporter [Carnobacterium mobile]|uniref:GRP family sugar transporter n=1 Tax=Carnobacterium mobile TaxID=2750 RepID=UPI001866C67C|nr:GRP family sugar transporter [Carnobacterium mobile]